MHIYNILYAYIHIYIYTYLCQQRLYTLSMRCYVPALVLKNEGCDELQRFVDLHNRNRLLLSLCALQHELARGCLFHLFIQQSLRPHPRPCRVELYSLMEMFTMENGKRIKWMAKVAMKEEMGSFMKVLGSKVFEVGRENAKCTATCTKANTFKTSVTALAVWFVKTDNDGHLLTELQGVRQW